MSINSPIRWDRKTMKIKQLFDRHIAVGPKIMTMHISGRDYEMLLKSIPPREQHYYEKEMMYHGRKILRAPKGVK